MKNMTREEFVKIDTLSDLLEVAIEDMRAIDRNQYMPNFAIYFTHNDATKMCHVCAAGAVMVNSLGNEVEAEIIGLEEAYGKEVCNRLIAIDALRENHFHKAWCRIHGHFPSEYIDELLVKINEKCPRKGTSCFVGWDEADDFIEHSERVIDELRAVGL